MPLVDSEEDCWDQTQFTRPGSFTGRKFGNLRILTEEDILACDCSLEWNVTCCDALGLLFQFPHKSYAQAWLDLNAAGNPHWINYSISGKMLEFHEVLLRSHYDTSLDLITQGMVKDWNEPDIKYKNYFEECDPSECYYYEERTPSAVEVATVALGLLGGLATSLQYMFIVIELYFGKRWFQDSHGETKPLGKQQKKDSRAVEVEEQELQVIKHAKHGRDDGGSDYMIDGAVTSSTPSAVRSLEAIRGASGGSLQSSGGSAGRRAAAAAARCPYRLCVLKGWRGHLPSHLSFEAFSIITIVGQRYASLSLPLAL